MSLKDEVQAEINSLPTLEEQQGRAPVAESKDEVSVQSIEQDDDDNELEDVDLGDEPQNDELPDLDLDDEDESSGDDEQDDEQQASSTDEDDKRYSKKQLQRKIEKRLSKEKRRREKVEWELEQLRLASEQRQPEPQHEPEPYDDSENISPQEYARRVDAERQKQELVRAQLAQEHQRVKAEYDAIVSKGKQTYSDFESTVNDANYSQAMVYAAKMQPNATDVLYYLGKKDEQAQEIMRLPPDQQAAKVARIAHQLAQRKSKKKVTRAPTPVDAPKPSNKSNTNSYLDALANPNISVSELAKMRRRG